MSISPAEREALMTQYVRDHLSPTPDERDEISRRYEQLRGFLHEQTFLNGSYARHTSTTPVNDLDVVYLLPEELRKAAQVRANVVDPMRLDINDIVASLADELGKCYGSSARVVPESPSVGVYFGSEDDFSIDVVPALPAVDDRVWIPEVAHLSVRNRRIQFRAAVAAKKSVPPNWMLSDPKGYTAQATEIDQRSEGRFRKAAKALKKWRWRCRQANDQFALMSFHLELHVTRWFLEHPQSPCSDAVRRIIEGLPSLLVRPQFPDRADPSRFVDQYIASLKPQERVLLLREFSSAGSAWSAVLAADSREGVQRALSSCFSETTLPVADHRSVLQVGSHLRGLTPALGREEGEQFLSDQGVPIDLRHTVLINAEVTQPRFRQFRLRGSNYPVLKKCSIDFFIQKCDVPEPYAVKWKVKNTGTDARKASALRGEINDDEGLRKRHETTLYWGNHYVECYVIKNGVCVAADHIEVPIGKLLA